MMPPIIKIGKYYYNLNNIVNIEIEGTLCFIASVDGNVLAVECFEQELQEITAVLDHMNKNTMFWR